MNESDFSWKKLAIFAGTGICVFVCFVLISVGLALVIEDYEVFKGAMAIVGAVVCLAVAGYLYSCWQRNRLE